MLWRDAIIIFWYMSCCIWQAHTKLVNRTIDDMAGDSVTGAVPTYLPTTAGIWADQTCAGCRVQADKSLAFDGTWMAATFRNGTPDAGSGPISIELDFTGTAVYVNFILANNVAPFITTETACNFTLDDRFVGSFEHEPTNSTAFQYNATVYSAENLPNTQHRLIISTAGLDRHVFTMFDYAIYTVDIPDTTTSDPSSAALSSVGASSSGMQPGSASSGASSSGVQSRSVSVGAVVGSAFGGVIILLLAAIVVLLCRRHKQGRAIIPDSLATRAHAVNGDPATAPDFREVQLTPQHQRHEALPQVPVPSIQAALPTRVVRSANLHSATREALRRERQAEIDYQLRELLREMRELNRDRKIDSDGPVSMVETETSSSAPTQPEVEEMRQQMEAMRAQTEHLRTQQNSDWAQGLSNDPPPGYTPRRNT